MQPEVYEQMAAVEATHWWFAGRRRILRHILQGLDLPGGARILEAGCGTGGNLALFASFGTVCGLEPNDYARAIAGRRGPCSIVAGTLPDAIPFDEACFDLVAALDVIEHVDDDAGALAGLFRITRPGGWGLFTVPAFQFLWSGHDEAHQHKRRYRRKAFLALLRSAGYVPTHASYFNTALFPAIAAVRGTKRLMGLDSGSDDAMPPPFLNRALAGLLGCERFLISHRSLPFGVSLLAVARKPTHAVEFEKFADEHHLITCSEHDAVR